MRPTSPPGAPTSLSATAGTSTGTVTLTWVDPPNNATYNGSTDPITGYNVWDSENSGAFTPDGTCPGATTTQCLIIGLTPGTSYAFYLVTETQNLQQSGDSPTAYATTLDASTISLATVSATYQTPVSLSATTNTPGTVDFTINGSSISSACSAAATTTSSPYVATCTWTPYVAGVSDTIDASFSPQYSLSYSTAQTSEQVSIPLATPSISLSGYSGAVYGAATNLTVNSNVNGAVEFKVAGVDIAGCGSVNTTGSGPYTATCAWTPSAGGATTLEAVFTSYDTNYSNTNTGPLNVTVAQAPQAPLTLTSTSGSVTAPLTLTVSGGSGTGAVTYAAADGTASGCAVSSSAPFVLTATTAGTCVVTATKAGGSDYLLAVSAPTTVTLTSPPLRPQATIILTTVSGVATTPLTLATSGGSGSGAVTYTVVDGTASGCAVSSSAPFVLTATTAGTCVVTATKAGAGAYAPVSSAPRSIVMRPVVLSARVTKVTPTSFTIVLRERGLAPGARVATRAPGVTVAALRSTSSTISVTLRVGPDARPGRYVLTLSVRGRAFGSVNLLLTRVGRRSGLFPRVTL